MKIVTKTVRENVVKCLNCEFETVVENADDTIAIGVAQKHLTEETSINEYGAPFANAMHTVRIKSRIKVSAEVQEEVIVERKDKF